MSLRFGPSILHAAALAVMTYGYTSLGNLVQDSWIRSQKGGHFQFLTIQGLVAAMITMTLSLICDLSPSAFTVFRKAKRSLFMIAMPMAVVITSIYWTLLLLFPGLILQKVPPNMEPTSSADVPTIMRLPLQMDFALHAAPALSLLADFLLFETKYGPKEVKYGGATVAALACLWYSCWVEYCASFNGTFPYPFLTENAFPVRVAIYIGATSLALGSFQIINALHS